MYTHELHKNPKLPDMLTVYSEKQKVAEEIKALKVYFILKFYSSSERTNFILEKVLEIKLYVCLPLAAVIQKK